MGGSEEEGIERTVPQKWKCKSSHCDLLLGNNSMVECHSDTMEVVSSNLTCPTKKIKRMIMSLRVEQIKEYLDRGELPPLDPIPYNDCIVHDGGCITTFLSKREALRYRREHNC